MQYFVSAKNTVYYCWQLELLIESFKFHNLEDSLTIALAEPVYTNYTKNLQKHKNIFVHEPMNRIYALNIALEKKLIQMPFTLIHADMILTNPIDQQKQDITFQIDNTFIPRKMELIDTIRKVKGIGNTWLPVGATICFQYASIPFFRRALEICSILKEEKMAWLITMLEYFGHFSYHGTFSFENCLLDNNLKNFIHYNHGLPPLFNKRMFTFEPLGLGNPYEILMANNVSKSVAYIQNIINKYNENPVLNNISVTIPIVNIKTKYKKE
jgi:hypothetical protein